MAPVARRFLAALEADGRVAEGYERRDDLLPFRVAFVRRDLGDLDFDRAIRVRRALDRLPSYRTALGPRAVRALPVGARPLSGGRAHVGRPGP